MKIYEIKRGSFSYLLPVEVYRSADLVVVQIAPNTFVQTSYLQTNGFGKVDCNGMIARDANEALVFDTPTNDKSAEELIDEKCTKIDFSSIRNGIFVEISLK